MERRRGHSRVERHLPDKKGKEHYDKTAARESRPRTLDSQHRLEGRTSQLDRGVSGEETEHCRRWGGAVGAESNRRQEKSREKVPAGEKQTEHAAKGEGGHEGQ